MKKNKFFILAVILILLIGFGGYYIYNKISDNKENDNQIKENEKDFLDSISIRDNVELNGTFLFEESFDYMINQNNHKITNKYYFNEDSNCNEGDENCITGFLSLVVYLDDKLIYGGVEELENSISWVHQDDNITHKTSSQIKSILQTNAFSEENIQIIKGKDKEYLILNVTNFDYLGNSWLDLVFINDNANVIGKITDDHLTGIMYKDDNLNDKFYNEKRFCGYDLNNDKLIILSDGCNTEADKKVYEYTYTVNNDKVYFTKDDIDKNILECFGIK